jgi:hypothetical protein
MTPGACAARVSVKHSLVYGSAISQRLSQPSTACQCRCYDAQAIALATGRPRSSLKARPRPLSFGYLGAQRFHIINGPG